MELNLDAIRNWLSFENFEWASSLNYFVGSGGSESGSSSGLKVETPASGTTPGLVQRLQEQWSWFKFDSTELFSSLNLAVMGEKQKEALFWASAFILLQLVVTMLRERFALASSALKRKSLVFPEDGFIGLDHRHLLTLFNGLLLLLTLIFM